MKRKREAIEKQLMENDEEQEEQTQQDWKDLIRQSKKAKNQTMQGSFDDL